MTNLRGQASEASWVTAGIQVGLNRWHYGGQLEKQAESEGAGERVAKDCFLGAHTEPLG